MMAVLPGQVTRLSARRVARGQRQGIRPLPRILYYLVCSILALLFVFPIFWSIFTSLKPPAEANASPPNIIPSRITFDNYIHLATY